MKKYVIIITCISVIALIFGFSANLTYYDFNYVAEYLNSDSQSVLAEIHLISKYAAWLSVYSLDYDVFLHTNSSTSSDLVDYVFISPEETPNGNGQLTLIIDGYDAELGIDDDLRRIGNMLEHYAIPTLPEDPDISDVVKHIGSGVRTILEGIRYFCGLIYGIITIIFHSIPAIVDFLKCFLFLAGFTSFI